MDLLFPGLAVCQVQDLIRRANPPESRESEPGSRARRCTRTFAS